LIKIILRLREVTDRFTHIVDRATRRPLRLALQSLGKLVALFFHPRDLFLSFFERGTGPHTH
jgi:hypothetical protein